MNIWIVVGTRPEVIKQVPVYWACVKKFSSSSVKLVGTGQHKELLLQALQHFDVGLDKDFAIMRTGQSLNQIAARVLMSFDEALEQKKSDWADRSDYPEWIVVQGDTTTAAMAAVAAFHRGVKVAHNEAGLRSFDLKNPFPEEANRKWISQIADLHFAPTSLAQEALHREGVDGAKIHLTGNTGVDALLWTLSQKAKSPRTEEILGSIEKKNLRPVFVTAHRRENADAIDVWFKSLASLLEKTKDLYLIYPMHPNNLAKTAAEQWLKGHDRVLLCEPFDYLTTCQILAESAFAVTDSGGIQEEGASLGIPVVVCRKTTERMEAVNVGLSKIADPSSSEQMWAALEWADQMSRSKAHQLKGLEYLRNNSGPFGDGLAAEKIANLLHEQV